MHSSVQMASVASVPQAAPLAILVPSCGEPAGVLCQVPGTNAFALPGTLYDPQTGRTRAIPTLPPAYRDYLCDAEHVKGCSGPV